MTHSEAFGIIFKHIENFSKTLDGLSNHINNRKQKVKSVKLVSDSNQPIKPKQPLPPKTTLIEQTPSPAHPYRTDGPSNQISKIKNITHPTNKSKINNQNKTTNFITNTNLTKPIETTSKPQSQPQLQSKSPPINTSFNLNESQSSYLQIAKTAKNITFDPTKKTPQIKSYNTTTTMYPPAKRAKTINYSHCVSIYLSKHIDSDITEFITDAVKEKLTSWYIPNDKTHVLQLVCNNHEDYVSTLGILNSQSTRDSSPFKYVVTPMNFSPAEHTLKYHTSSYDEMMKYTTHIIKNFWKRTNGVKETNTSYDRVQKLYKIRIAVESLEDKEYFMARKYSEYRSIDQIITESKLNCSCNFSSLYTEKDIKTAIQKMVEKSNSNYKATNVAELEKITKFPTSITPPNGTKPTSKKLISTTKYLVEKFKKQQENEVTGATNNFQFNNDLSALEKNHKSLQVECTENSIKLESHSKQIQNITNTLTDHTKSIQTIFEKLNEIASKMENIELHLTKPYHQLIHESKDDVEDEDDESYHPKPNENSDDEMEYDEEEDIVEPRRGDKPLGNKNN
ncbi:hypothetical protein FDP41_013318 [Naegleria fowleri]|uniref:Uncharacterized protein n=1 Tax=Naegleria fowleri TaxID=5763 RepID=A0A6A5C5T0_NAEFO|nr:uncharacterized protein FDP41_013318 [Naegleria fowleri]KAF0980835.1 hypothetical protein FDP41_013318 [Naegleria fowleri]